MSYILSALRKAEQERRHAERTVTEQMTATTIAPPIVAKQHTLLYGLLAALVIAVVVMAVALLMPSDDTSRTGVVARPASTKVLSQTRVKDASISEVLINETPIKTTQAPAIFSAALSSQDSLSQAEAAKQKGQENDNSPLPKVNITGYIYFKNAPQKSKLFVDGLVYQKGGQLPEGITITEFHKGGVAVLYKGSRREMVIP